MTSRSWCAAVLATALGLLPRLAGAADGASEEAGRYFREGVALAREERFDEASRAFESAFQLEKTVEALFGWAQAERLAGRCPRAALLYQDFLAMPISEVQRQAGE